jgi:uncharacterized protein YbjT (DUF2867 family)
MAISMKINIIITGATGMVGEGVLKECLSHPEVEKVLVINRRPCGFTDNKLTEIIHPDFFNLSSIEDQLAGYDACFFCLGVSSVGMKEKDYTHLTHTLTLGFAGLLARVNPGMTFCYISGAGTDSTEKGKMMWARVKGKTENDLMSLPFKKVFAFRPGFLMPSKGARNIKKYYYLIFFLYPFLRLVFPKMVSTLKELGLAMINSVIKGYEKPVLEVADIVKLSKQ